MSESMRPIETNVPIMENGGSVSLLRKTPVGSSSSSKGSQQKTAASLSKATESMKNRDQKVVAQQKSRGQESSGNTAKENQGAGKLLNDQQLTATATKATATATKRAQKLRRRVATMAQRRAANIRERRRMLNLNSAFDRLRKKVPSFAYEKRLSRIETLKLAIMYIRFMDDLVRDEAYVEKYKRLTSNYASGAIGTISSVASSTANYMSPYLSSLYGHSALNCDSPRDSSSSLSPDPAHQLSGRLLGEPQHSEAGELPAKTTIELDATDNCPPYQSTHTSSTAPTARIARHQQQPCTDGTCMVVGSGRTYNHIAQRGGSSCTVTTLTPPITASGGGGGGVMVCCPSPALSSPTTCNSSSNSVSSTNSFSNSPDPSPNQLYPAPVCRASMNYYQQRHQTYGNYSLDRSAPCFDVYADQAPNQPSEHASKTFYNYDATTTTTTSAAATNHPPLRQGQPTPRTFCEQPPPSQPGADECCLAINLPISVSGQFSSALVHTGKQHNQVSGGGGAYTLHSLQAR